MARILVAEDNPRLRTSIGTALEMDGHSVVLVGDGKAAIHRYEQDRFDLVVSDISMPELDGIRLLIILQWRDPHSRILAISGGGWVPRGRILEDALALGAVHVLPKPFDLDQLLASVGHALTTPGTSSDSIHSDRRRR